MAAWVIVVTAGLMLAVVMGSRWGRNLREKREQTVLAPLRPSMLEVAAGEDADASAVGRLTTVPPRDARLVDKTVSEMLSKVRGEPARALAYVLRTHGRGHWARQGLQSRSAIRRAHSAWTLGLMREVDAGPQIAPLLEDRSALVVVTAARALTMIGDGRVAHQVVCAVAPRQKSNGLPSWAAIESLCAFSEPVGDVVVEALQHPDPTVRYVAATVIDARPLLQASFAVRQRLPLEDDIRTVVALLAALGRVGSTDDLAMVSAFAQHPDEHASLAAVEALESLGSDVAVIALRDLLNDPRLRVAERAAIALAELGPAGRAPLLVAAADEGWAGRPSRYALELVVLQEEH